MSRKLPYAGHAPHELIMGVITQQMGRPSLTLDEKMLMRRCRLAPAYSALGYSEASP